MTDLTTNECVSHTITIPTVPPFPDQLERDAKKLQEDYDDAKKRVDDLENQVLNGGANGVSPEMLNQIQTSLNEEKIKLDEMTNQITQKKLEAESKKNEAVQLKKDLEATRNLLLNLMCPPLNIDVLLAQTDAAISQVGQNIDRLTRITDHLTNLVRKVTKLVGHIGFLLKSIVDLIAAILDATIGTVYRGIRDGILKIFGDEKQGPTK